MSIHLGRSTEAALSKRRDKKAPDIIEEPIRVIGDSGSGKKSRSTKKQRKQSEKRSAGGAGEKKGTRGKSSRGTR